MEGIVEEHARKLASETCSKCVALPSLFFPFAEHVSMCVGQGHSRQKRKCTSKTHATPDRVVLTADIGYIGKGIDNTTTLLLPTRETPNMPVELRRPGRPSKKPCTDSSTLPLAPDLSSPLLDPRRTLLDISTGRQECSQEQHAPESDRVPTLMPLTLPLVMPVPALIANSIPRRALVPTLSMNAIPMGMASLAPPAGVGTPGLSVNPSTSDSSEASISTPRSMPDIAVPAHVCAVLSNEDTYMHDVMSVSEPWRLPPF